MLIYWLTKTRELESLRRDIFEIAQPLRTGIMPWASQKLPTRREAINRKRFGTEYNVSAATFRPHFTLAMFKDPSDAQGAFQMLNNIKFKFTADTIAICEVNFWHQVTRVIKTFKLNLK